MAKEIRNGIEAREALLKGVNALVAQQGGQDRDAAGDVVQLLPRLVDRLIEGEVFKAFHKFRIRRAQVIHGSDLQLLM